MKNVVMFLLVIGLLMSCSKDENPADTGIVGKWELIEVLNDPGDGSGEFQAIDSDKILEFFEDGTVTSNGSLCRNASSIEMASEGVYSEEEQTIKSDECPEDILTVNYTLNDGVLILKHACIEPCEAKYTK